MLDNLHLTVRQTCFMARHLNREHILFLQPNSIFLMCVLDGSCIYSPQQKIIYIEVCQYLIEQLINYTLFKQYNHHWRDLNLLLQSHMQATDKQMVSKRFFSLVKTMCLKIENEMHGYHIFRSGRLGVHTRCTRWSNSQCRLICRSPEVANYSAYPT